MSGPRILIAGASGGIGRELVRILAAKPGKIGAQYHRHPDALRAIDGQAEIKTLKADLSKPAGAMRLVADFVRWAGGIDALVQLSGDAHPAAVESVTPNQWQADIDVNLSAPFFLAREAMKRMPSSGGRIVLTGTASAVHGGGSSTMAYGAAKAAIECVAK